MGSPGSGELPSNETLARVVKPWKGDLDGMIERRYIRVLTVNSPVLYFVDRGQQRGAAYEMLRRFESHVNKMLEKRHVRVHLVMLPVGRHELIPRLVRGEGDLAVALLTITPEREALVDFSIPVVRDVSEVLVTGPASEPVEGLDDLAGREVYLRASSSYAEHLAVLNERLAERDLPPVEMVPADELLGAEDILEMVNAGLVPATFVDSPLAEFYMQLFDDLQVHEDIVLNSGGKIGWAFRQNSPQLEAMVNEFLRSHRQGTLVGNVLLQRYLGDTRWVENIRDEQGQERFRAMVGLFRKYAERYDLDPLLLVAQGYQESKLDHSQRSRAGAVGVMQMLPSTARDKNVGIPDITDLENNIHAGARYLRWMMDRYYDDPGMTRLQQELFALASYNAGPAKIARLRKKAESQGLDPDLWFDNVEIVAAREIGRETVQYVANIYKYYLAYVAMEAQEKARNEARERAFED
ncbi:MAG: transporter substrate-binding domain-containing protein [Gammaproteobacteria bacterium]|jgi:membrane-bound lytic murein transglycosylase MltF